MVAPPGRRLGYGGWHNGSVEPRDIVCGLFIGRRLHSPVTVVPIGIEQFLCNDSVQIPERIEIVLSEATLYQQQTVFDHSVCAATMNLGQKRACAIRMHMHPKLRVQMRVVGTDLRCLEQVRGTLTYVLLPGIGHIFRIYDQP